MGIEEKLDEETGIQKPTKETGSYEKVEGFLLQKLTEKCYRDKNQKSAKEIKYKKWIERYERADKWIETRNFEILPEFTLIGKVLFLIYPFILLGSLTSYGFKRLYQKIRYGTQKNKEN